MHRPVLVALAATAALALSGSSAAARPAAAAGPSLAVGSIRYELAPAGSSTLVRRVARGGSLLASSRIAGRWTLPRVAADGTLGGLSADRSALVLTRNALASPTRLALLDGKTLRLRRTLSIPGRFSFDALSPDASRLYLIEYVQVVGETRYRVRAYDLLARRLEDGIIADKRSGWTAMEGEPIARAATADGAWVYTLYGSDTRAFVHALNAAQGYAVCVDLPLEPAAVARLRLRLAPGRLALVTRDGSRRAEIDTASLRVVR
jgi:hypothetical protein